MGVNECKNVDNLVNEVSLLKGQVLALEVSCASLEKIVRDKNIVTADELKKYVMDAFEIIMQVRLMMETDSTTKN